MCHWICCPFRIDQDLADNQPLSGLQQSTLSENISIEHRFSQKIDMQVGRDSQGNFPNLPQNRHIGRTIRHHHQCRARNGLPGSQVLVANRLTNTGNARCNFFNLRGILRKLPSQEIICLFNIHSKSIFNSLFYLIYSSIFGLNQNHRSAIAKPPCAISSRSPFHQPCPLGVGFTDGLALNIVGIGQIICSLQIAEL